METTVEADTDANSPESPTELINGESQVTHVDDISTFGPSNAGDKSSFALWNLGAATPEAGVIDGRVGDGMVRLTWTTTSGLRNLTAFRIYRRDYGASQHYSLRTTIGADTCTFEDTGLADGKEADALGELGLCPMRVPVTRQGKVVGIVSRTDLLRCIRRVVVGTSKA